jgi:hypothetical protein
MKIPKLKTNQKLDLGKLPSLQSLHLEKLNPLLLIIIGAVLLLALAAMLFTGRPSQEDNEAALERAKHSMGQTGERVQHFRRVFTDQQVRELALMAAADPGKLSNLQQYLKGRIPGLIEIKLHHSDLEATRAADLEPFGYAL